MIKLNAKGLKALKVIHLFCAILWVGGAIGMMVLVKVVSPSGEHEMYMYALALKTIDDYLIIPGANGCVITGLIYGLFTNWGFFKHRWIVVKWAFTLFMMASGTFLMGPCVNGNVYSPDKLSDYMTNTAPYWDNLSQIVFWGAIQVTCLFFVIVISVYKPWKPLKKNGRKVGC